MWNTAIIAVRTLSIASVTVISIQFRRCDFTISGNRVVDKFGEALVEGWIFVHFLNDGFLQSVGNGIGFSSITDDTRNLLIKFLSVEILTSSVS